MFTRRNLRLYALMLLLVLPSSLFAERLKDIAEIQGVRNNPLVGYGLVVGLDGTGEQTAYTTQTFKTMLKRFGITLPANVNPKLKNIPSKENREFVYSYIQDLNKCYVLQPVKTPLLRNSLRHANNTLKGNE